MADGAILLLASLVGALEGPGADWRVLSALLAVAAASWAFAGRLLHQYDANNGRGFSGDVTLTVVMLAAIAAPIGLCGFLPGFPARAAGGFLVTAVPIVLVVRAKLVGVHLRRVRGAENVLVVGVGALGRLTASNVGELRQLLGYLRFDDEAPDARLPGSVLGRVGELETVLEHQTVDEVYFASTSSRHAADVQRAIQTCERFGVPFALPACDYRLGRAVPAHPDAVADGYVHYLSVQVKPLQLALKRAFDILMSGAALVLLSPLLVAVAAAVKLTSRGPVLFRQQRVGLHGRAFGMLKFRSMVDNADALKAELLAKNEQSGPVFKMKRDPRVTTVGRFIRKFSIDELPQLVNVLRGDMSIVGPRPPVPSEVARYLAWQRRRLSVPPGLTCVWQVSGRNQISFEEWMLLDMRYIDHWSLIWDFNLILKTVPVVLTGRGAS